MRSLTAMIPYSAQQAILLIEDSPEDRVATTRALRQAGFNAPLYCYSNAKDALVFLDDTKKTQRSQEKLGLILLDLNMPGIDGREVLRWLKADEELRLIPVVVLTTSSNPQDVRECYSVGANSYSVKPVDYGAFKDNIAVLLNYWFGAAKLPE